MDINFPVGYSSVHAWVPHAYRSLSTQPGGMQQTQRPKSGNLSQSASGADRANWSLQALFRVAILAAIAKPLSVPPHSGLWAGLSPPSASL